MSYAIDSCMLDYNFNKRILELAPKFEAKDVAPSTFAELKANTTSGLVVWSGASENTIYGDAIVNHAFRAWHDMLHLKLNAPFNEEGETRVALEQARLIQSDNYGKLIMCEVVGQVEFFNKFGMFPTNQVEFFKQYIK